MARTIHVYSHHAADSVVGIRMGVNTADEANRLRLPPRGRIMRLAAKLAVLQFNVARRNVAPTVRYENLRLAIAVDGDATLLTQANVRAMLGVDVDTEAERNRIARERYAENRAEREAAAAALARRARRARA